MFRTFDWATGSSVCCKLMIYAYNEAGSRVCRSQRECWTTGSCCKNGSLLHKRPYHPTWRGLMLGLRNERAINGAERLMSDIQRRIDRIHWYHEFDFGNGLRAEVKTPDAKSHHALWLLHRKRVE